MAVYQITSEQADPRLASLIPTLYHGQIYHWGDRVWFVQTADTTQEVAKKLGVPTKGEKPSVPIVRFMIIRLSGTYWGWAQTEMWEWLESAFKKDSAV
jgi:hypothetical protein